MQTVPRSDLRRAIVRFAVAAVLVGLVIPLLPVYGTGGQLRFVFSLGFPLRWLIEYFLGRWTSAIVVAAGILFLRRDQLSVAGGAFAAVALSLAIMTAMEIVDTAPRFGRWQTDVVLALEIAQTILVALAAARAIGASGTGEPRSGPVANADAGGNSGE
jgi:hypothetical protein